MFGSSPQLAVGTAAGVRGLHPRRPARQRMARLGFAR